MVVAGDLVVPTELETRFTDAGDEYHRPALSLITSYKEGDLIKSQGQFVEIVSITETAAGILIQLDDDRLFIASDTLHMHRGRMLKANHPSKPTVSVDPGAVRRMEARARKRKR